MVTFTFKKTFTTGRLVGLVTTEKLQFVTAKRALAYNSDIKAKKGTLGYFIEDFREVA